jgi:carboxymethylenebutenolidase
MRDPRRSAGNAAVVPRITQEMIAAYDEYTHLTLDRRGFMEKLARLAGSAAAAAAIAPMLAPDYARADLVAPGDQRLAVSDVAFPGQAGDIKGYLALPAAGAAKLPAVLVIHENRGLNPHIKDVTRRVGLEGFLAFGIDLLSRKGGTPPSDEAAAQMFQSIDRDGLIADLLSGVAWLKTHPRSNGNVGAVGFCFGGGMVNQLAVASPDLKAGVAYYGAQPTEGVDRIKAKLMLHYAGLDERIDAGIPAYESALKAAGVDYQLFMYDGANHAFNNDTSAARYDKAAADLAWSRTIAFLKQTLG